MSYELFDTGEVYDFNDTPAIWQNFITDLTERTGEQAVEDMNMREWHRLIESELAQWGARTVDRYGDSSGLVVGFKLLFEDEGQASLFVLRWK